MIARQHRLPRLLLVAGLALLLSAVLAGAPVPTRAHPMPQAADQILQVAARYKVPNGISEMAAARDGTIWFASGQLGHASVGLITLDEDLRIFPLPPKFRGADTLAPAPDGSLWFLERREKLPNDASLPLPGTLPTVGSTIYRVTADGQFSALTMPDQVWPTGLAWGSDGQLWFDASDPDRIGRLDLQDPGHAAFIPVPGLGNSFISLIVTADGMVWFTIPDANAIGRISPAGVLTRFPLPTNVQRPDHLAVTSDGTLWFIVSGWEGERLGRITSEGQVAVFIPEGSGGHIGRLVAGPDNTLWFGPSDAAELTQITANGDQRRFYAGLGYPYNFMFRGDGALWLHLPEGIVRFLPPKVTLPPDAHWQPASPPLPTPLADYSRRWLRGEPCRAPCWEGVTPGQTRPDQALTQWAATLPVESGSLSLNSDGIGWAWRNSPYGGVADFDQSRPDSPILRIQPSYEYLPSDSPPLRLGEIVQAYGPPSHIVAQGWSEFGAGYSYTTQFIWSRYGIEVEYNTEAIPTPPKLGPDLIVTDLTFYALPHNPGPDAVPWRGYLPYKAYCHNKADPENACDPAAAGPTPGMPIAGVPELLPVIWALAGLGGCVLGLLLRRPRRGGPL